MSNYNRIIFKERVRIEAGIYAKKSFSQIAEELGRSTSSITREVKQNRIMVKSPYACGTDCVYPPNCRKTGLCGDEYCTRRCWTCTEHDCTQYCDRCISRYDEKYAKVYLKCKEIVDRLEGGTVAITKTAEGLKEKFSSEYLSRQIDLMVQMQVLDPTNAIGMAKELIESCCKTILDELGVEYTKDDDVPQLASKTMDVLNLLPTNVNPNDRGADAIKAVLGNLRAIPTKLAELRNPFGSGHGKSATFQGLEVRHAKLAVGSSITFVDFIWSTYESSK